MATSIILGEERFAKAVGANRIEHKFLGYLSSVAVYPWLPRTRETESIIQIFANVHPVVALEVTVEALSHDPHAGNLIWQKAWHLMRLGKFDQASVLIERLEVLGHAKEAGEGRAILKKVRQDSAPK